VTLPGSPPKLAMLRLTNCSDLTISSSAKLPESSSGSPVPQVRRAEEAEHAKPVVHRDDDGIGGLRQHRAVVERIRRIAGDVAAAVHEHDHRQLLAAVAGRQILR
jgi:hypothetical protein